MIPARSSERAHRRLPLSGPIQAPCDSHRSHRTGIGRGTPQDLMVPLLPNVAPRDIEVEAGQFVAQCCALGSDKEPMDLLFQSVEILYRRARFTTLTQEILELIHRVGLTGQEGTVL